MKKFYAIYFDGFVRVWDVRPLKHATHDGTMNDGWVCVRMEEAQEFEREMRAAHGWTKGAPYRPVS